MEKKEKPRKLTKKQMLLKAVQLPVGGVKLRVIDDIRAEIEGCTGIIVYDENEVKLSAGRLAIGFVGSNLQIAQYDSNLTIIEGFINCVNYERGKKI